jgi:hypothetical protein
VGIACEQGSNAEKLAQVNQMIRDQGINYPILMSRMDSDVCPVQEALRIEAFPTLILVDREGHILWRDQGASRATLAKLDKVVVTAMQEKPKKRF